MIQHNGTTLAYIGDAVYELMIRDMLLKDGFTKVDNLHNEAIKYTSAVGQKKALDIIYDSLTEEEISVFKRGRNSNSDRKARNASLADYKQATGFEAVIGYLHLDNKQDRLMKLLDKIKNESK